MHIGPPKPPLNDQSPAAMIITEMDQLHRLFGSFRPTPPLRRSDIGLLIAIERLSATGGRGATVSTLARAMHQSSPAISQRVSLLQEQSLVRRTEDKNDRRVATIELTAKGKKTTETTLQGFLDTMNLALDKLGEEDTQKLIHLIHSLRGSLEEILKAREGETNL